MDERLQKLIAAAGLASRRGAEELIRAGEVTVNGATITKLGAKASLDRDHIKVRGKLINPRLEGAPKIYILLNKPRGYLSTRFDPEGRPIVTQLLPDLRQEVHPVGRLDFNTEGLLLLTNDGELTYRLTAPKFHVPKQYVVKVKGVPTEKQISVLLRGVVVDHRRTMPAEIHLVEETKANAWFQVTLIEGRNLQIRKMFEKIGHSVIKLRRVAIGPLSDSGLPLGKWRRLTLEEVRALRVAAGLEEGEKGGETRQKAVGSRRRAVGSRQRVVGGRRKAGRDEGIDRRPKPERKKLGGHKAAAPTGRASRSGERRTGRDDGARERLGISRGNLSRRKNRGT